MSIEIKTVNLEPKRQTFGHIARRFGADKPASRYQEGTLDVQATDNFHYKPLWEPEYWHYDTAKTAVVMADWYKPLDPRQYYYATYNISRANMQQAVERGFTFAEDRNLIGKLAPGVRAEVERGLLPLRHLHWGANMNMTEICQRGYGTAITAPSIFSAADHLGMAQIISRIGIEMDGQTGTSLDGAKQAWLQDAAWQGARHLIEDTFVERDWFELLVAQTLAVNGVVVDFVYKPLLDRWADAGATVLAMLCEFMTDWRADESRWSDHVIKVAAAESVQNAGLISGWAKKWIDRAEAAAQPLSVALTGDGMAATTVAAAARQRAKALGLAL